jgi:ring-1,2-phenylacetyl-CoA epoxidase subunit PaaC
MGEAGIPVPMEAPYKTGSAKGIHTEWLGYMLAELQFLPKTYPSAQW